MSYGNWKALHPHIEVDEELYDDDTPRCKVCGDVIQKRSSTSGRQRRLYCSSQCSYEAVVIRNREFARRKRERMMADGKA